jgi:hypothetical protein
MPTIINFAPASTANFQFSVVLDGLSYTAICTYNNYSQRYYINIYDNYNILILSRPIIASPPDYGINLAQGYFNTSTLVFEDKSQNFVVTP